MVIYLDNAATSYPKPTAVASAIQNALEVATSPGRSLHKLARNATLIVQEARQKIAALLGCTEESIVLTYGCTDALNMAIKGILREGDHVVTTALEHNSVLRPLRRLSKQGIIKLSIVDFDEQGYVSASKIANHLTPQTKLIAVTAASNVLGTVQPVAEIAELAQKSKVLLLVDAAQALGTVKLSLEGIDLLACGGHKGLLGPTGTGFLYVATKTKLNCWREGGTGSDSLSALQPEEMPYHLEAGTPNVLGLAGLAAAIDYLLERTVSDIAKHELRLTELLLEGLAKLPKVKVYGNRFDRRIATVSLSVHGYSSEEVAAILDESFQIAVRGGLHCAPLVHQQLGTTEQGLVRVSFGPFNKVDDVEALLAALLEISQC